VAADPRGDAVIELRGRVIPLTDFAAQLLRELKSAARAFLGREATRATRSSMSAGAGRVPRAVTSVTTAVTVLTSSRGDSTSSAFLRAER
jgi:hypothetical protein